MYLGAAPGVGKTYAMLSEGHRRLERGTDVEVLRVFISQLRKKVEPDPTTPTVIVTDPGIEYRWAIAASGEGEI